MSATLKIPRRQQILEALASELELNPGSPITTASLARAVGISEAALYRHFPSKAKMFEALIEFCEETIFSITNRIQHEERGAINRCQQLIKLMLGFSERNPGITRILLGDALIGENERLRVRVGQFYERLETQLKQFVREGVMHGELPEDLPVNALANLMLSVSEGRMNQFVRSGFRRPPTEMFEQQWNMLTTCVQEYDTQLQQEAI